MARQYNSEPMGMKALVAASGVHRQTVHFYLREGLLPPPVAGAGTRQARYSGTHLGLLELLRELRDKHGLSLEAIRRQFERAGFQPEAVRQQLRSGVTRARQLETEPDLVAAEDLAAEAGVDDSLLELLDRAGALAPDPDDAAGRYPRSAALALRAAAELLAMGMSREALARLGRGAGALAAVECAVLADSELAVAGAEAAASRAERRHAAAGELVTAVRRTAVERTLRRLMAGSHALGLFEQVIYRPSALFMKRHGLDRVLARAEATAVEEGANPHDVLRFGRLLMGVGRYREAELWLARCARALPEVAEAHAYLGLARAISGPTRAGVRACERAVALAPRSPRAHVFLAAALGVAAVAAAGLEEGPDTLGRAVRVAARSRELAEQDVRERMEVLLARGRMLTFMPSTAPEVLGQSQGVSDLTEVLARTEPGAGLDAGDDYPGSVALYRVHALFYLGVHALRAADHAQATRLLGECITLDPASRFAEQAYDMLSQIEATAETE
jgi:DNA-binding transcriptional MerR regulator